MSGIKSCLGLAWGFAGLALLLGGSAQAQSNYPNRAIRVIVPYPAGGIVDIVARAVTEQVGRDWKQTVVSEARPGGKDGLPPGGRTAMRFVRREAVREDLPRIVEIYNHAVATRDARFVLYIAP